MVNFILDDFTFIIINFPFFSRNIPASPAYGVYISQLMCYLRVRPKYIDFLDRTPLLTQKLFKQGYVASKLKSSLQKLYGHHHNLVDRLWNIHISNDNESLTFYVDFFFPLSLPKLLPKLIVYMSNTVGVL